MEVLYQISTWVLPVLLAVTFHEAAHGFVAWRLGDDTAYRVGRVTFNPLRHIDLFGTVILPAMLLLGSGGRVMFGFAKPVPVDFQRLRRPRRDMVIVAAAGPAVNIAMAILAALLVSRIAANPSAPVEWLGYNLFNAVWINVLLAVFNMLPVPPLDGGRVAVGLLPDVLSHPLSRLEPFGFFLILGMLFILPLLGSTFGVDIGVMDWLVVAPAEWIIGRIFTVVGGT